MLPNQDAHKDGKGQKGRKRKFGPLDTKHTVTSVVFLQQDHIVATSGPKLAQPLSIPCSLREAGARLHLEDLSHAVCL